MFPGTWLYVYLGSLVPNATGLTTAARAGGPAGTRLMLSGMAATVGAITLVTRAARQAVARN